MPKPRIYYPALDGLRAVAFLMVFAQHYGSITWGWSGVDIFFVLSGFLITGILLRTREQPKRYQTFYTRRILRIFPLYYGVFAVLLALAPLLRLQWNRYWWLWVLHVGNYLRNWPPSAFGNADPRVAYGILLTRARGLPFLNMGHFWSLCVEEQFYLVWPLIVFNVRSRHKLMVLGLGLFTVMPLIRWEMERTLPLDAMHGLMGWATPFRADALLLGSVLSIWGQYPSGERALVATARISYPFAAVALTFSALLLLHYNFIMPPIGHIMTYTLVDAAALVLIFEAIRPASLFCRVLQWKPLMWLGALSYGAYIFHDIPHSLYTSIAGKLLRRHSAWQPAATATMGLIATYCMAYLSFRFYESRFLRYKNRLAPDH